MSAALGPLAARCTIDTVERMQGREQDLVIVCFAGLDLYGDDDGVELDFVYDACRIVVALTRAKKKCVVPRPGAFSTRRCTCSIRRPRGEALPFAARRAGRMPTVAARLWPGRSRCPSFLAAAVPAPAPPPPTPEEQLVDLSQALSLEDHVTTPDSDDETVLEEDAPSPTKRDRARPRTLGRGPCAREWVAPPKSRRSARGRCIVATVRGRPKRGTSARPACGAGG